MVETLRPVYRGGGYPPLLSLSGSKSFLMLGLQVVHPFIYRKTKELRVKTGSKGLTGYKWSVVSC
jgi:hypothetical protein